MDIKNNTDSQLDKIDAIEVGKKYIQLLLASDYNVRKAFLFGSYARDNYNSDSDIDIAVILNAIEDPFHTQVNMLKLTWQLDTRIEPHPFNLEDLSGASPVLQEIQKYGIEIYSDINVNQIKH